MQELYALVPRAGLSQERIITLDTRLGGNRQAVRATAMVFADPGSAAIKGDLERLAPSDASLVIIGETGTGKEVAARYIHDHSGRKNGPFLAVNCGAFVESLVEAELFGYEKGAFTGALKTQAGWFEAANGGTLLLDEIGDLPLPLQVKLLRVLQEREVVRVGGRTPVPVDVRVIAATNIDLAAAVTGGRVPPGPLLPPQRRVDHHSAASRPARRSPRAHRAFPRASSRQAEAPGARADRGRPRGPRRPCLAGQHPRAGKRHPQRRAPRTRRAISTPTISDCTRSAEGGGPHARGRASRHLRALSRPRRAGPVRPRHAQPRHDRIRPERLQSGPCGRASRSQPERDAHAPRQSRHHRRPRRPARPRRTSPTSAGDSFEFRC